MVFLYIYFSIASLVFVHINGISSKPSVLRTAEKIFEKIEFNNSKNITSFYQTKSKERYLIESQSNCLGDIKYMLRQWNSNWTLQMLDATGKIPSGTLLGNFLWMGKYQECVDVRIPTHRNAAQIENRGLYCVATWNLTMPNSFQMPLHNIPIKTGICLPSSCGFLDIEEDLKYLAVILRRIPYVEQYYRHLSLTSLKCKLGENFRNSSTSIFLIFLALYLSLITIGSLYTVIEYITFFIPIQTSFQYLRNGDSNAISRPLAELTNKEDLEIAVENEECGYDQHSMNGLLQLSNKKFERKKYHIIPRLLKLGLEKLRWTLKCFCLFRNAGKILDHTSTKKSFPCIHGIRFISMAWVILGHTYIHNINIIGNYVDFLRGVDSLPFQVITQGTFSVDTFFLISGFLLAYIYLEEAEKRQGNISWFGICLHRLLRITPVYMLLIAYNTLIFQYTGKGPFWGEESDVAVCKQYWWWNLLYINNFLPIESMCVTWTWYLANDMQFFAVGTILLYILWRWRTVGIVLCILLMICSWVVTWWISYYFDLVPLFWRISKATDYHVYKDRLELAWNVLYIKPYCRIGPYIIGILLATTLQGKSNEKKDIQLWIQGLIWSISTVCCCSMIYGVYYMPPIPYLFHFYNSLSRSIFSAGVAWIIYSCLLGQGGIVNQALSLDIWVPLSRLTYCAYLFHPLFMSWYFESQNIPLYFTHINMIMLYFAFLVVSYSIAFIISMLFEAPLINLENLLRKKFK